MKVLHIATYDGGGAGMGMINQHLALLEMGISSKILVAYKNSSLDSVFEYKRSFFSRFRRFLLKFGIHFDTIDSINIDLNMRKKQYNVLFSSPITHFDISNHPLVKEADVINLHWVSNFVDIPSFFSNVDKPIVWTMRDENPGLGGFHYLSNKKKYYDVYKSYEDCFLEIKRESISNCNNLSIVSLSNIMLEFCKSVDFLKELPNNIIYNAINPNDYLLIDRKVARKALDLDSDCFVVSFVSVYLWDERKGLNKLLSALDKINNCKIRLICVGRHDGCIPFNSICLGSVNDKVKISEIYSASDVFISPSEQESFGKTVVEALYCGTPVISSKVGVASEVINSNNGFLLNEITIDEIVDKLMSLQKTSYSRLNIRNHAISLFSPQEVANKYVNLYNTLISNE